MLCCLLLISCKTQRMRLSPFVVVYKSSQHGEMSPHYILLRTQPKMFEIYATNTYESIFGRWNINSDTLFLLPEYEIQAENYELKSIKISQQDSTVASIKRIYLIKNDKLIDLTNYDLILPDWYKNTFKQRKNEGEIYWRVK